MIGPMPLPDGQDPREFFAEMAEKAQQEHDEHMMRQEARHHQMMRFIESLEKDDLVSLLYLFQYASSEPEAMFRMIGMVQGRLRFVFQLCEGCGQDHAHELLEEATTGGEARDS